MYLRKLLPFLVLSSLFLSQHSVADEVSSKIINGTKSDSDRWPFMVALVFKNTDVYNGQFCGASFLGGRYILTAAHCVDSKEAQDVDAVIGISDLRHKDVADHRYSVKEIYIHSSYENSSTGNDIAILELENEVNYTPVNLADKHLRNNLSTGETLTVMGWGDQDPDRDIARFKSELYQVNVPLVEQGVCSSTPGYAAVTENAFCAGFPNGGYDSCQGDSGGPIVVSSGGDTYEQLGIVSWGNGCAEAGNYGVYANVSYFSDWISSKTKGFSYRNSEFVGAKPSGAYSHSFSIRNNTGQVVRTSGATIQGAGALIAANNCSEIAVDGSCEITIDYTVGNLDFGNVSVNLLTDLAGTPSVDLAVSYIGIQSASTSVIDMISVANSGVYSSENPWISNGSSLQTPSLSDNELSQLTITGLAAGSLSFDVNISTEPGHDYLNIYVNGHLDDQVSGVGSGELTMNLPRENNIVVFEYKKDSYASSGYDRVTISNLTHSVVSQSAIPDGNSTERSSGSSGGAINWMTVLSLGVLALGRRRFYS